MENIQRSPPKGILGSFINFYFILFFLLIFFFKGRAELMGTESVAIGYTTKVKPKERSRG
jgi:hypothetical protein